MIDLLDHTGKEIMNCTTVQQRKDCKQPAIYLICLMEFIHTHTIPAMKFRPDGCKNSQEPDKNAFFKPPENSGLFLFIPLPFQAILLHLEIVLLYGIRNQTRTSLKPRTLRVMGF